MFPALFSRCPRGIHFWVGLLFSVACCACLLEKEAPDDAIASSLAIKKKGLTQEGESEKGEVSDESDTEESEREVATADEPPIVVLELEHSAILVGLHRLSGLLRDGLLQPLALAGEAQLDRVEKCLRRIPPDDDFGAFLMCPSNRHFSDLVA